jgi:hypothetical protein
LTGIAAAVLLFAPQLAAASDDDDMPDKINFSGGIRGKFHRTNVRLSLPIYLEADVQDYLAALAAKKGYRTLRSCERAVEGGHRRSRIGKVNGEAPVKC